MGTRQHSSQIQLQHEDVIVGAGGERKKKKKGACLNSSLDCSPAARMPPRKDWRQFVEATSFDSALGVIDRDSKTFGLRPAVPVAESQLKASHKDNTLSRGVNSFSHDGTFNSLFSKTNLFSSTQKKYFQFVPFRVDFSAARQYKLPTFQ